MSELKAANVSGTLEVLNLACTGKLKPLHFTSTIAVFSPHAYEGGQTIQEDMPLAHSEALHNGFSATHLLSA